MLIDGLRQEGHEVFAVPTNVLGLASRWRRIPVVRGVVNFLRFLPRLWRGCSHGNVVHIFSHSYLSFVLFSAPAVAAGKLRRKRVLLHYHGGAAGPFLKRWYWLLAPVFRAADAIIVPSGFLGTTFATFNLTTVEVPNILPLANIPYRDRPHLLPRIVMARHLEPAYNIACGLRAFALVYKSFPDAVLTVAGDGSERLNLVMLCSELGITQSVRFTGNIDNQAMIAAFDKADIYLNSSRIDNQPVSLLEAFACGLAVVSTDVGGIPHMARHGEDALLAPDDDAEALAACMMTLLQNPELATRLIRNGRERVQAHSWESIYSRLQLQYQAELPR